MAFSLQQLAQTCKQWFDIESRRKALYATWEEHAEQGNSKAAYRLIALYPASPAHYPLAFKWTLYVANQGEDCLVLLQLAQMLETGAGTPADLRRALTWYERTLSLHIMQGIQSPLSVSQENYIQEKIQSLRKQIGWENN